MKKEEKPTVIDIIFALAIVAALVFMLTMVAAGLIIALINW